MSRRAQCSCGALSVEIEGEPAGVVACHCVACQRRTGSVFGVGAYYARDQLALSGPATQYTRPTDAGHTFTSYFCPTCGTSVYWHSGKNPGMIGVAVGAIADPHFPAPARSVWERAKHDWVELDAAQAHFPQGRVG
jgi:hypothetical protein